MCDGSFWIQETVLTGQAPVRQGPEVQHSLGEPGATLTSENSFWRLFPEMFGAGNVIRLRSKHDKVVKFLSQVNEMDVSRPADAKFGSGTRIQFEEAPPKAAEGKQKQSRDAIRALIVSSNNLLPYKDVETMVLTIVVACAAKKATREFGDNIGSGTNSSRGRKNSSKCGRSSNLSTSIKSASLVHRAEDEDLLKSFSKYGLLRDDLSFSQQLEFKDDAEVLLSRMVKNLRDRNFARESPEERLLAIRKDGMQMCELFLSSGLFLHPKDNDEVLQAVSRMSEVCGRKPIEHWSGFVLAVLGDDDGMDNFDPAVAKDRSSKSRQQKSRWQLMSEAGRHKNSRPVSRRTKARLAYEAEMRAKKSWKW
jgi:hypothetical protein